MAFILPCTYFLMTCMDEQPLWRTIPLSTIASVGLLVLRKAYIMRSLPEWAKCHYTNLRIQLAPMSPEDVEGFIAQSERNIDSLKPKLAKGVVWADPEKKEPTEYVVVFVHGWK